MEDVDESVAECTAVATLDAAAELRLHRLLPVTDAEQRDARIEDRLRDARATLVDHRRGAAREDDATGSHPFEGFLGRVERRDLARSEEHTSELQSLMRISYAVFCLKKKTQQQ